jgi:D-alanine-D-alanine ligase
MKVLILTGGDSSERRISLLSASNVKESLESNGHRVTLYDLKNGYERIKKLSQDYQVFFPVLHGEEGEGGKLHKFLSTLEKPIVGTRNYKGMMDGWYKIPFKKYCTENGIKTSEWRVVTKRKDILEFGFPSVLKTSSGGSSREVSILKSESDLDSYNTKKILRSKIPIYVERFLPGIEVTVGVLNNKALPVLEIVPKTGSWFSYKNKYDNSTQEIPFAPSVDKKTQINAQQIALKIHNHFNLGTYSRTDFIVSGGIPYVLEINTIPGLTKGSLLPKEANAAGLTFNEFTEILLKSAK